MTTFSAQDYTRERLKRDEQQPAEPLLKDQKRPGLQPCVQSESNSFFSASETSVVWSASKIDQRSWVYAVAQHATVNCKWLVPPA